MRNKFETKYGSHIPMLIKALSMTDGDVLELGVGMYSTPLLHYLCVPFKRKLVSYDNDQNYIDLIADSRHDYHQIHYVENWDDALIDRPWDVVFVDHGPGERRIVEIKRLANLAKLIVIHDCEWRNEKHYHYRDIYPLFKWTYFYTLIHPNTGILSNFINLYKEFNGYPH